VSGPTGLGGRLRARIQRDGPLPFSAWMDACLYDPDGGFYRQAAHPAGTAPGSHFATAPALHPFFARCVADEVAAAWLEAGRPPAWRVAEFGAGTGALAAEAMRRLREAKVPAAWTAVDVRPGPALPGVSWSAQAPAAFDCAVANEFLDAVPFDLHEWRGGAWQRVGVGLGGDGRFAWTLLGPSRAAFPPGRTEGERRVNMPGAELWVDALAQAGARMAVVADYGQDGPSRGPRAYAGHAEADPLAEPGTVDITASVDWSAVRRAAEARGFRATLESQEQFLLRHGVLDALNAIDRASAEGASSYLRLRQLLLPTGLGAAFQVLTLRR